MSCGKGDRGALRLLSDFNPAVGDLHGNRFGNRNIGEYGSVTQPGFTADDPAILLRGYLEAVNLLAVCRRVKLIGFPAVLADIPSDLLEGNRLPVRGQCFLGQTKPDHLVFRERGFVDDFQICQMKRCGIDAELFIRGGLAKLTAEGAVDPRFPCRNGVGEPAFAVAVRIADCCPVQPVIAVRPDQGVFLHLFGGRGTGKRADRHRHTACCRIKDLLIGGNALEQGEPKRIAGISFERQRRGIAARNRAQGLQLLRGLHPKEHLSPVNRGRPVHGIGSPVPDGNLGDAGEGSIVIAEDIGLSPHLHAVCVGCLTVILHVDIAALNHHFD